MTQALMTIALFLFLAGIAIFVAVIL